jgi:signal transduction histidine kinase
MTVGNLAQVSMNELGVERSRMAQWQAAIERRSMLPIKWALWLTALGFWYLTHPNHPVMPVAVFALFTVSGMANVGLTYLWLANRVSIDQVPAVALASWICDLAFVVGLVVLEQHFYPGAAGPVTDFHLYFFVMVLRGFSLFRTPRTNLVANLVVVAAFVLTLVTLPGGWSPIVLQGHWVRGVFILLLVVMSWMIVEVLDRQKEELGATRARLAQAENFALLGRLAGSLAHEMNNPMGIIAAHADYLLRKSGPEDPRYEDYRVLGAEARRCGRILSSLMQFSQGQAGREGPVQLDQLAEEVVGLLPSQRAERISGAEAAEVITDPAVARLAVLAALLYAHASHEETASNLHWGVVAVPDGSAVQLFVSFVSAHSSSGEGSTSSGWGGVQGASSTHRPGMKAISQAMGALGGEALVLRDPQIASRRRIELHFPVARSH